MIYRATLIPDATARIAKWRGMFQELTARTRCS